MAAERKLLLILVIHTMSFMITAISEREKFVPIDITVFVTVGGGGLFSSLLCIESCGKGAEA